MVVPLQTGVTTYVIAWMLQTRSMSPSLIYKVSFPFVKLYKLVSVKTKQHSRYKLFSFGGL